MHHCQNQNQKHKQKSLTNIKWIPLSNLRGIRRVVLQNMSSKSTSFVPLGGYAGGALAQGLQTQYPHPVDRSY